MCKSLNLTLQTMLSGQDLSDTTTLYLAEYQFHKRTSVKRRFVSSDLF
jgi:hypothetical protein